MAVRFHLPNERPLDDLRFAWSPLFEAVLSMRTVVDPKRAPMHLPWVRRCREVLDDALHRELIELVAGWGSFVPGIFEVGLAGASPRFEDELAAFAALDDDLVAYELTLALSGVGCDLTDDEGPGRVGDAGYRQRILDATAGDPACAGLARAAFDDPAALRDRYGRLLEQYWESAFADEWDRLLPRVEAEVTAGSHALVTAGAPGLVRALLPEGRWDEEACSIVVDKDWDGQCEVAGRGPLLFVPTVYGWPCVLIELAPPWPLAIVFPLRELRHPQVPQASDREVVEGFKALADETRLQIARLVAEDPRSTKELAELLSLSDSAISRHLKILESAGLVQGRRDGYFVLYALRPERVEVLGRAIRATLGLAPGAGGDLPALPVALPRSIEPVAGLGRA